MIVIVVILDNCSLRYVHNNMFLLVHGMLPVVHDKILIYPHQQKKKNLTRVGVETMRNKWVM